MAKLLWEWKPRFAVALVVRDLLIVTSHTNCDVTSGPVVMRRYANADGDEQWYKTSKTQVSRTFSVNCLRPRRPAQPVLFRIAVPTTPAQTVSWSIPIITDDIFKSIFNESVWISITISLKFIPKGPIDYKSALVQVMAWHRTGEKPLPESMLTQFTDAYIRH